MRSSSLVFALALSFTLAGGAARATDVPVGYLVDAKELKRAVAGTQLSFALFSDAACTTQLATSDVAVEALQIEEVKLVRVKGAPKLPKAARLGTTLTGVAPSARFFLSVTGTGVSPVGAACQAQLGAPPAPLTGANVEDGSLRLGDLGGGIADLETTVGSPITLGAGECKGVLTGNFGEQVIGQLAIGTLADPCSPTRRPSSPPS